MKIREIQAKTLLSKAREADPYFGILYTMNLYRGCSHRCIYCDSRSECYQIEDFDGEVLVKVNAIELLAKELSPRRQKGRIGTGSMNDPYQAVERKYELTRQALDGRCSCCWYLQSITFLLKNDKRRFFSTEIYIYPD